MAKHAYAASLLDRYQAIYGSRGLTAEVQYLGGRRIASGLRQSGAVVLDVVEGPLSSPTAIYDYKFGVNSWGPSRINQIRSVTGFTQTPIYDGQTVMQPISKEKLAAIAGDYASAFSEWQISPEPSLFREVGPVRQSVTFESLSWGAYRVGQEVAPVSFSGISMLWQYLAPPNQTVRPGQHGARWRAVVAAIEQEFSPPVRKPLNTSEVAQLCAPLEREGVKNDLAMMAVLYAWLGEHDEAKRRCIRLQSLQQPEQAELLQWDRDLREFSLDLLKAMEAGRERTFLETPWMTR